jgi:hypothetical protein
VVGGVIIQHQDFVVRIVLLPERLEAGNNVLLFIPGRDQNGDERQFLRQLALFGTQSVESPQIQEEIDQEYERPRVMAPR